MNDGLIKADFDKLELLNYVWTHVNVFVYLQPTEIYVDDDSKLTLHGLQQYYCGLMSIAKNRKLIDLLDVLEFNQVTYDYFNVLTGVCVCWPLVTHSFLLHCLR